MASKPRPAFTIIEMAIALAVTVILMSIAIPRFNNLTTRQEFYGDAQALANCLQTAQSLALNNQTQVGSGPARWIGSEIVQTGASWTCRVVGVGAEVALASDLGSASLTEIQPAKDLTGLTLNKLKINNTQNINFGPNTVMKMFFSSLDRGVPAAVFINTVFGSTSDLPAQGTGQLYSIIVQSVSDTSLTAQVSIQKTGAPINVVKE